MALSARLVEEIEASFPPEERSRAVSILEGYQGIPLPGAPDVDAVRMELLGRAEGDLEMLVRQARHRVEVVDVIDAQRLAQLEVAEDILAELRRTFPPEDWDEVIGIVARYGTESWHHAPNRTRRAIVRLGHGDKDALRRAYELAHRDFRDALMASGDGYGTLGPFAAD